MKFVCADIFLGISEKPQIVQSCEAQIGPDGDKCFFARIVEFHQKCCIIDTKLRFFNRQSV